MIIYESINNSVIKTQPLSAPTWILAWFKMLQATTLSFFMSTFFAVLA